MGNPHNNHTKVAVDRTNPDGRVVGIDVIPAQPPTGVSTIQGNFLSASVRGEVKRFLREARRSNVRGPPVHPEPGDGSFAVDELESNAQSSLEHNRQSILEPRKDDGMAVASTRAGVRDHDEERMVDVVLSDMSAPWEQTDGFWKRSLSDPYYRMMNTSGINFRDHAGSMVCQPIVTCDDQHSYGTLSLRTFAELPSPLRRIHFALVATSFANSIKVRKTGRLKLD